MTSPRLAAARPQIYVQIQGVKLQVKPKCGLDKKMARAAFTKLLRARPEVTLDLGEEVKGSDLARVLKQRKLTGYGMVLRVTKCGHELHPPAKGKVYRVLMVEAGVAIDAEKIPSGQLALAGVGSSQVGTEVSRIKEKERLDLLQEALTAAAKQAVDRSVTKLTKKKSRRRRSRRRR